MRKRLNYEVSQVEQQKIRNTIDTKQEWLKKQKSISKDFQKNLISQFEERMGKLQRNKKGDTQKPKEMKSLLNECKTKPVDSDEE